METQTFRAVTKALLVSQEEGWASNYVVKIEVIMTINSINSSSAPETWNTWNWLRLYQ